MPLDEREDCSVVFIGKGSIPRLAIEEGNEATLYHNGNLVMATITPLPSCNEQYSNLL